MLLESIVLIAALAQLSTALTELRNAMARRPGERGPGDAPPG